MKIDASQKEKIEYTRQIILIEDVKPLKKKKKKKSTVKIKTEEGDEGYDPTFKPKKRGRPRIYPEEDGLAEEGGVKKKSKNKVRGIVDLYCDYENCTYTSKRMDKLRQHKRTVHEGLRYPCDMCDYAATRPDKLKNHREAKHLNPQPRKKRKAKFKDKDGEMQICDKCDYKSDKWKNFRAHQIRNHSDSIYHCDQCEYVGTYKHNLTNHYIRMHSGKMLMCDKCDYTTRDPLRYD